MSPSCLLALPLEYRRPLGLEDPSNPVVRLGFRFVNRGAEVIVDSDFTVLGNYELVRGWVQKVPRELRMLVTDLDIEIDLNADSVTVKGASEITAEQHENGLRAANILIEELTQYRALLVEMVAMCPSLQSLETWLTEYVNVRVAELLEGHEPAEVLPKLEWVPVICCSDHHDHLDTTADWVDYVAIQEGHDHRLESYRQLTGRQPVTVPVLFLGQCRNKCNSQTAAEDLTARAVSALLGKIVPAVYAELAPGYTPPKPATNEPVDIVIVVPIF